MENCVDAVVTIGEGGEFCAQVIAQSGQPVTSCYQCQRCGAGCPVAIASGTTPNRFLRLLQLGLADEALKNPLLWLCVGCGTCGTRCPNKISTNEVIDQLRSVHAPQSTIGKEVKDLRTFHRLFLRQIQRFGRLHELFLISGLKLRTLQFFKDLVLGQQMFMRGKIPLLPHHFTGIPEVKALFKKRGG